MIVINADTFLKRFIGFMFVSREKAADTAILFMKCNAVHTCFMRFPIDLVYYNRDMKEIKRVQGLKPWRFSFCYKASSVLEIPSK
ncbi:MAG: DUF192 domain-containing protein [Fibrobacteres bacterium]|nr:DUF192 domain-containing protein [Fibrobacterota bacterium]